MYTIAFDTTGASCSIILLKDNKISRKFMENMDYGQSEVLLPEIRNILNKEHITFEDINLVVVCTGPGSFTGVRSSIAAARTFGLTNEKIQVTGVSAFEAYIHSLEEEEKAEINAVIIETKREDYYYQLFDYQLKKITEPAADSYENIISQLRHKKVTMIGDGVERFLAKPSGLSLHAIRMENYLPIEQLGYCGLTNFLNKKIDFPKPLYLRAPDVFIKR